MMSPQVEINFQVTFMHRVLRAMIKSHPDPSALVKAWQEESSEALAQMGIRQLALDTPEDMNAMAQRTFWQWDNAILEAAAAAED